MALDCAAIKSAAERYKSDMVRFLRAMISRPSESCEEGEVVACVRAEMEKLGYDRVEVDGLGNVIGWMGDGDRIIAIDSHVDTVGVGNRDNWTADPYEGYETDEIIYGRGASDQEGGLASAVYGVRIMKELGLIPEGYRIMVVGSVQEEDCDGMCWQYIVQVAGCPRSAGIRPGPARSGRTDGLFCAAGDRDREEDQAGDRHDGYPPGRRPHLPLPGGRLHPPGRPHLCAGADPEPRAAGGRPAAAPAGAGTGLRRLHAS